MKIQPGLADADDLGVRRHADQVVGAHRRLLGHVVRVDPDRAPDRLVFFGQSPHGIELRHPRADRLQGADARFGRTGEHALDVVPEVWKVEMTVAVDQHPRAHL